MGKKAKPIFKDDCKYFAVLICQTKFIDYYCLKNFDEAIYKFISCGKYCPFYKKGGVR